MESSLSKTQYSPAQRAVEIIALLLFALSFFYLLLWDYRSTLVQRPVFFLLSVIVSVVVADFLSGLVHWFADTWGFVHWKIIGPTLIRNFRIHHIDPIAITRHDFVETNGASALVSLPVFAVLFVAKWQTEENGEVFFWQPTLLFVCLWSLVTNQIHKWAHAPDVAKPIRWLQNRRLILSKTHHDWHHQPDHTSHYCITTGWLNPLLNRSQFFRMLERVISVLTGWKPREDDAKGYDQISGSESV